MKFLGFLIVISILVLLSAGAFATVWTVDSNPGNHAADFTSLQAAHDGAAAGDTIYLSGFSVGYGNATIAKKLYIFGPGYYLNQNDSTQANTYAANTGNITFQTGSDYSVITGCNINALDIYADNITIKRNRITGSPAIYVYNNADYINIIQNYIDANSNAIHLDLNNNNINITNNYVEALSTSYNCINVDLNCTNILVENNVLFGKLILYNSAIINNIYIDGAYTGNSSNTILNNICNLTQFDTTGHNQQNVDMNTVFIGSGTTDGQWQIDPNGPAAGNGTFGTDIGMFGGNTPYILSGIPVIPTIYYFYGPSNASQSLQIQTKIKSRR